MELIDIKINLTYDLSPTMIIEINDNTVYHQKINTNIIVVQSTVPAGDWQMKITHIGKNYEIHNDEFFEIQDIFLNDVPIGHMIWDTTQIPTDISDNEISKHNWEGNLYFGHNAYCVWNFTSPVEKMLRDFYNTNQSKTINAQETTRKTLNHMKQKFQITN